MLFSFKWVLLTLFVSLATEASVVTFSGAPKESSVSGTTLKVYPTATLALPDGTTAELKLSGSGVRKKSVLFVPVNVYAAASYVQDPAIFNQGKSPQESLRQSPIRFLQLTMLRAMSGNDMRTAFEEALDLNGVDLNQTAFVNLFSKFNFDTKPGDTFIIATSPKASLETLVLELPNGSVTEEGKDLGFDFWKVWFGQAVDNGISDLQKNLIGK